MIWCIQSVTRSFWRSSGPFFLFRAAHKFTRSEPVSAGVGGVGLVVLDAARTGGILGAESKGGIENRVIYSNSLGDVLLMGGS